MNTILLIGKEGQIGWELQRTLACLGTVVACGRKELDLQDETAIVHKIRELKPTIIVNAAAYTAVDRAENVNEPLLEINASAPGIMMNEAKKSGAILVHYSTDYVFNGLSKVPYQEDDLTCPLNRYGQSKLAGENAIRNVGGNFLILRTSWVYGNRGHNFLQTMLRLGKERKELRIVDDQIGAPTWSRLIAETTSQMLGQVISLSEKAADRWGTYHLTAAGQTSWYGFAKEIFHHYQALAGGEVEIPILHPIPSSQYPTPAVRPVYSVLSNEKLLRHFQLALPDWKKGLSLCMEN
jgi:dTDP-4-dehydrorhamnose reductase